MEYRYLSMARLRARGLTVKSENYEPVYSGPLPKGSSDDAILEALFVKFDLRRPSDFGGHSASVSDVVILRRKGVVTCYYCDTIGFVRLPNFLPEERARQPPETARKARKPKEKER